MEREEDIAELVSAMRAEAAAEPGDNEERDDDRHDDEAEEAERRAATPDEIGAHDEPDEEVERARPCPPREACGAHRLGHEQPRLRQPAEAHAPDGVAREPSGTKTVAHIGNGRLGVAGEGGPEEQGGDFHLRGPLSLRLALRELGELRDLPLQTGELEGVQDDV